MDLQLFWFPTVAYWTFVGVVSFILYRFGTVNHDYFSNQNIPGPKPIPYFGNLWGIWKKNLAMSDSEMMNNYGKVVGYFEGSVPILFTTDTHLIRSIFIKDFDHFINRRDFTFRSKYYRKMISLIHNREWKDVRTSVAPAFTTAQIKRMSTLIKECADVFSHQLADIVRSQNQFDAKAQFGLLAMDVIAKCAFGMTINLSAEDSTFVKKARVIFNPDVYKSPLICLPFMLPRMKHFISESLLVPDEVNYFLRLLEDMMKQRAVTEEKFNDFVQVAVESIGQQTKIDADGVAVPRWNRQEIEEIIIAQATIFLLAGFDTTASTLTSACFLLAKHQDVQQRLHNLIANRIDQAGELSHNLLLDLPYLDHFINEVMRMFPPVPRMERECNKDISYGDISIKKGTLVIVPVNALHHSRDYYQEPGTFNPDRWNFNVNKQRHDPYSFMPFGLGPRHCVGMRFAMENIKIALCTVITKFHFFPVPQTPDNPEFEKGFVFVSQTLPITIGAELRTA